MVCPNGISPSLKLKLKAILKQKLTMIFTILNSIQMKKYCFFDHKDNNRQTDGSNSDESIGGEEYKIWRYCLNTAM